MGDLLVMCHCEAKHGSVMFTGPTPSSIQYVDTNEGTHESTEKCLPAPNQFTQWFKIPNSSIDTIYGVSCPLYGDLYAPGQLQEDTSAMYRSLNKNAWNVLRPKGIIIVPLPKHDIVPDVKLKQILKQRMPLYAISIVPSSRLRIRKEGEDAERCLVFQKPTGGKRKTRRRKTRRTR